MEKGLNISPVVFDIEEEDYLWRRGRPWGVGGHFNDDKTWKGAEKCP